MSDYITKENLLAVLPSALANDESMASLADGIAEKLASQNTDIDAIKIYSAIQQLPESLCDLLAVDFKVDWYNYNYPLAAKRNMIASSFIVHRTLGTVGAVKKALSDIYPGTSIEEWFDYGGDPYYFRVVLDVTKQLVTNFADTDLRRTLPIYKRLGARLEDDEIIFRSRHYFLFITSTGYVPYTVRYSGTYPDAARQGAIERGNLELETRATNSQAYSAPLSGTSEAGTYPSAARQGSVVHENIEMLTSREGVAYGVPAAGTAETGTYPDIATDGEVVESNLVAVTDSSGGFSYDVPLCGDNQIF